MCLNSATGITKRNLTTIYKVLINNEEYNSNGGYPGIIPRYFSPFFHIFSVFSGFVFVSGDTVMAANRFKSPTKAGDSINNIDQTQLTGGHSPETFCTRLVLFDFIQKPAKAWRFTVSLKRAVFLTY
jgi:hypothetical protein